MFKKVCLLSLLVGASACTSTNGVKFVSKDAVNACQDKGPVIALLALSGPHAGTGYTAMQEKLANEAIERGATDIVISEKDSSNKLLFGNSYKCSL